MSPTPKTQPPTAVNFLNVAVTPARPKPTNTECALLFFLNLFLIYSAVNMWRNIDAYDGNTGQQSFAKTCWKMVAACYILIGVAPVGFVVFDSIKSMRNRGLFTGKAKEDAPSSPLQAKNK